MTSAISRLAIFLPGFLLAFNSHAATAVYQQAPGAGFADVSSVWNNPGDPGFTWSLDMDEEAWAYFRLPGAVSFNRIGWYGSNGDGDFAVDLFAASCFSCGVSTVKTDGTFSNNLLSLSKYNQTQIHKTPVSAGLYSYYIDLPSHITLDGTSPYYALSVVNNYSSSAFSWSNATSGIGSHLRYIVGQAMFLNAPGNLAFTLTDTTPSTVPLPGAVWLFSSALGALGIIRRKTRATGHAEERSALTE